MSTDVARPPSLRVGPHERAAGERVRKAPPRVADPTH